MYCPWSSTIQFASPVFQLAPDPFNSQLIVFSVVTPGWIEPHNQGTVGEQISQGGLDNEVNFRWLGDSCLPSIDFLDSI